MKKNGNAVSSGGGKWRKLWLIMKLKTVFLLLLSFQLSAAVHSQTTRLTLRMENATLEQVLWEIQRQTDFVFMYGTADVAGVTSLNVDMTDRTVPEILDYCLKGTRLTYEVSGNAVVLKMCDEEKKERVEISGEVKDSKGNPLPGVTVVEKGTSVGVATGVNGRYTFTTVKKDSVTLVFSFVGMKTQEVVWRGQKELNVTMVEEAQEMEEVVVTGYQTVKKSNMAGSVSTVSAEDLVLNGTQTLEQALQGKLPGVVVQNTSGLVGVRQKVRVRGTSTLLGSQEPVWVVDGIIQEDPLPFKATDLSSMSTEPDNMDMIRNFVGSAISWLNPSDIENVTVLKDASATAIYGVKAANGVIVITTKRGEKGRMSISYSGNFSIGSKVTYDKLDLMNSKERVDVSREIYESGLVGHDLANVGYQRLLRLYLQEKISYDEFNTEVKKLEVVNTDWFDLLYENPFSYSNNISISGGSDKTTYYASFGITKNNGTAKGNDTQSYQGSINVNTLFWDCLQFSGRVSGSVSRTDGFHSSVSPYSYASITSRVISAFDEDGEWAYYLTRDGYKYNILNELAETGNGNKTNALNVNLSLNWEIVKGLKYEMSLGYGYTTSVGETWATEQSNYIAKIRGYEFGEYGPQDAKYQESRLPHGGELSHSESTNENYTWRNQLSWVKNWGTHLVTATVGQEASSSKYEGYSQTLYGYLPERGMSIKNPPLTTTNQVSGSITENTLYASPSTLLTNNKSNKLSFYGAFTYTYDERYVFNASVRSDASNRFGQDRSARFLPVWSFGLRWNMGREHFLEGQDLLNECSIRLTYGYQGNASEAASPDLIARIPSGAGISDVTGEYYLNISSLPNPKLRWEKTATLNVGVDFVFWKNKINGSFEYYYKKTTDAVVNKEVPYENGVLSMPMNGGSLENSGWELAVSFSPVRTNTFMWTLGLNTSKNYNKVTSTLESNKNWTQMVTGNVNKEGYAVSSFWAFEFAGLSPDDGTPLYNLPGVDTDAAQTDASVFMKHVGKLDPDFTGGVTMGFRWKDLSLSSSFYLSAGGKKFLAKVYDNDMFNSTPYEYNNLPKDLEYRWRKPGDENHTNIPSLPEYQKCSYDLASHSAYGYEMYNYTDIRVVNASYFRCNNISLSYNLSKGWIKRFAQNLGVTFNVSNPFMIVSKDFKGKDPEVATGAQPFSQNYSLSVNLSF